MNKVSLITVAVILFSSSVYGQQPATEILLSMINNVKSHQTVQVDQVSISKNPFSSGDTIVAKITSQLKYDGLGNLKSANEVTTVNGNQSMFREVLTGDSVYTFDLLDSTYTIKDIKSRDFAPGLTFIRDLFTEQLTKNPSKIVSKADTLIGKLTCYHIMINSHDTVINRSRNYTHHHLLIDKATLNPVYYKEVGEGVIEKSGYVIGRLQIFNESRFSNYIINDKISSSAFSIDRSGFSEPNKAMLALGTQAPRLELKTLSKDVVAQSTLSNKLLLLEFGATACAANPLANPC